MDEATVKTRFRNSLRAKNTFIFSVVVFGFWVLVNKVATSDLVLVGVILELLWMPMCLSLLIIPFISYLSWKKERYHASSLHLYSILMVILTILWVMIRNL
ncbi:MAG: hypothetical protein B7Y15_10245 [Bacteroidetes bacterium 24-39-8]|jgi:hypothetical protein|nr:MAG: hypothetical protein B7Y69_08715 [Sphingobacteriia bacterium 35-40-8]OYZ49523.1 MAG: hypothetical protein B7Y15_10245 [Bacteroidetes bacterium 24-39-8]OZA68560.1 MAG: hypothetical protein B7X72_01590 [Sphingobacteriia bacterium 39-39-8]HQR93165.1 hypothetical protein [Sediminibacterium sp.]HQS55008.1 hypothetical protein [Sediminibacterium sp.]